MVAWNFNADEVEEREFKPIPIGDHRIRIADVEEQVSRNGNDMWKFTFEVSGYNSKLFWYLVFMPENSKMTNTNLSNLWKSFGIKQGDMNCNAWIGKVGACHVAHQEYNGEQQARVGYLLTNEKKISNLPPWKDPENSNLVGDDVVPDWATETDYSTPFD